MTQGGRRGSVATTGRGIVRENLEGEETSQGGSGKRMIKDARKEVKLEVPAEVAVLPVVTGFVENAGAAFGLGRQEVVELTLASEEVFSYIATVLCPGAPVFIDAASGIYYLRVTFRFPVSELNLKSLNITSSVSLEGAGGLEEMGLIIATRFVDRLNISRTQSRKVNLDLIKEKRYEPVEGLRGELKPLSGRIVIHEPPTEAATEFAAMVCRAFEEPVRPLFFRYPGKVADMVASGEYGLLTAVDEKEHPAGGLMFFHRTERLVQFYGPYALAPADGHAAAEILTQALMSRIARTKVIGLVSFNTPAPGLLPDFEELGALTFVRQDGPPIEVPVFYRLLHEDPGGVAWVQEGLLPFLRAQYDRLVLAREINLVRDHGESAGDCSIFSADVEAGESRATIRPIWPGSDFEENLGRHIATFQERGILNILCEIDLGVSWHARVISPLLETGFVPRLVVPFAGKSDLVVFQHYAPAA
jgi:hypothetical protein